MIRFRYFAHLRTMSRLASKSSSKTRRGSFTYCTGFAIATRGSTASHFLTWYSIHSREMVMSPSTNLNRGFPRQSPSLWSPTSIPNTSQSFCFRIAWVSELPMKPLAPRMRTRRGMDLEHR